MDLQKVQYEGCFQVWMIPPLHAKQSVGYPGNGETVQVGVSGPLHAAVAGLTLGRQ